MKRHMWAVLALASGLSACGPLDRLEDPVEPIRPVSVLPVPLGVPEKPIKPIAFGSRQPAMDNKDGGVSTIERTHLTPVFD